ncbi:hypothetical protein BBF96_08970 [Anoxybacter fermentans]|uniref:Major facilitator superfamily (MFS) profile domain-containing protein n=1 Tax=Anoxybacter fermentans TaxID=1323375 RepID=A0A3Q9HR10_9FIRM|nr:MFS transporter [Anoxybacter fermentans]AZR73505.1 hypothetical protein BBF96_08970 [Anoxybacter fermentans]
MTLNKVLRFFKSISALQGMAGAIISPYWIVYFSKHLTYSKISILVIVNYAATLLFEIPTGIVADVYSKKLSVIISLAVVTLSSIGIYLVGDEYVYLLIIYAVRGIGATFMSGAYSAWFTDSMISIGEKEALTEQWGRLASVKQLASAIGFVLGTGLALVDLLDEIWLVSALFSAVALLLVLLRGIEVQVERETKAQKSKLRAYVETLKEGSLYLFKDKILFVVALASAVWYVGTGMVSLSWQPYFSEVGIVLGSFGVVLIFYVLVGSAAARYAGNLTRLFGGERRLMGLLALVTAALSFLITTVGRLAWLPFVGIGGTEGLKMPVFQGYLNKELPSTVRATVLSSYSMFVSVATIVSMALFGFIGERYGLGNAMKAAAIMLVASAALFFLNQEGQNGEGSIGTSSSK